MTIRITPMSRLTTRSTGPLARLRSPRAGLAATKEIVAGIRAGRLGREPEAYGAALRTSPEAKARIEAFVARRKKGSS